MKVKWQIIKKYQQVIKKVLSLQNKNSVIG